MAPLPGPLLSASLGLAGPSLAPALMARLHEETLAMLRSSVPLPGHVVNNVIVSGDRELLLALAKGTRTRQMPVLLRLAALGDPSLARRLYGQRLRQDLEEKLRRAVLAGAAERLEDPGWRAPDGLVSFLLSTQASGDLVPALGAPFPEVVRHAVGMVSVPVGVAGQFEACRAVLRYGGVGELAALAGLPALRPEVAEVALRAVAAPDPEAVLEAAVRPGTVPGPDHRELVDRLRGTVHSYQVFSLEDIDVDWDAILAEQRTTSLPAGALATLASRRDCPDELVMAAYRECRGWDEQPSLSWALLRQTDRDGRSPYDASRLLAQGIADGRYPAGGVLAEVRPAPQVLTSLPFREASVREAMAELVRPLGEAFATWRALYALLPRFAGTATELVSAAVEQSARHRGKRWPRPLAPEFPAERPEGARAAFLHLFRHASDDVQSALVAHLDLRSVQHLLLFHPPSPAVRARVIALHRRSVLAVVASRWDLPAERIQELIVLDDPEINTCLYVHTKLTDDQRRGILSGRRFGTDGGTEGPLPVTDQLARELQDSGRRHWLLPICDSGDPRLVRILLGKVRLQTLAGQLLPLLRVWERHGAAEVAALLDETVFGGRERRKHPLPIRTLTLVRQALKAPDGLAALREELARAQAPAAQAAILRGLGRQTRTQISTMLDRLAEETGLSWEGLAEEHGRDPLPDLVVVQLTQREDCPEALHRHSAPAALRLQHDAHPHELTGPRPSARDLLRHHPLPGSRDRWLNLALQHQQLTLLDVVREARPARSAAHYLAHRPLVSQERAEVLAFRELRELVAAHLGDDPEAWAVALRLLPDFPGTLPELLATTAAVVS